MTKPTARQLFVLRWIVDFQGQYGYCPSLRDIGVGIGIKSIRGVTVHLDASERKGLIERASTARGIVVTVLGFAALDLPPDTESQMREIKRRLTAYRDLRRAYDRLGKSADTREQRIRLAATLGEARECLFKVLDGTEVSS